MNPLFNILNGGIQPQNPMMNMITQLSQFRQTFQGNPKQQVQQLLNSGKMSQEQFNQLSYKFYFKEDDEKSRLFDDNEEDLLSKLTVININI